METGRKKMAVNMYYLMKLGISFFILPFSVSIIVGQVQNNYKTILRIIQVEIDCILQLIICRLF